MEWKCHTETQIYLPWRERERERGGKVTDTERAGEWVSERKRETDILHKREKEREIHMK